MTLRGGRVASFLLKDYRQTSSANSLPYQIIAGGDRLPLGVAIARGAATVDDGDVIYSSDAPARIDLTTSPAFISRLYGRQGRDRQRRRPDELDLVETMIKPSTD